MDGRYILKPKPVSFTSIDLHGAFYQDCRQRIAIVPSSQNPREQSSCR
jgi:hypothetical protein